MALHVRGVHTQSERGGNCEGNPCLVWICAVCDRLPLGYHYQQTGSNTSSISSIAQTAWNSVLHKEASALTDKLRLPGAGAAGTFAAVWAAGCLL